jgi:hypothetical protein
MTKRKMKELRKVFVRRFAAVSDLHIMSRYSLFPPNFETKNQKFPPNDGQLQIWNSYKEFCDVCDEWEVETVLVAGDVVHGQNYKERGLGLMSTNMNEQIDAACTALKPLLKGRKSHWVSGSGYHVDQNGLSIEELIFDRLQAEKATTGAFYGPVANLNISPFNKLLNLTHGGGRAAYYRESIIAREIVYGKVANQNGKLPKIDMYIHGHFHWFNHLHQQNVHHLQLPGWTAYEPASIFTQAYTRMQPDIGGALILFDDVGRTTVWPYLYPLPHIADFSREI